MTSDVIEAAYNSVWLWAQAVSEAGTADIPDVIRAMRRQSLNARRGLSRWMRKRSTPGVPYTSDGFGRRPVRSGLELGKADPSDPLSAITVAGGVERLSRESLPNLGRLG